MADPSLTPEQILAHTFTSGFRGYDQQEVRSFLGRVANELRDWQERAENLESAWHSAEERAARPPVLDEDTLMAAVGEETAGILRTARAAAAEMRAKAAAEAEQVNAEGRAEAERLVAESEAQLERATSAAEEAAMTIREEAEREASEARQRAQTEADAVRAKAEQDRALTIEGANSTRDRILEDLARRRRVATIQIEQLRAGRERLIESYAVVRRTLEEAQTELSRADAEARAVADEVGARLRHVAEVELSEASRVATDPPAEPEIVEPETVEPETVEPETVEPETVEPETAAPETAEQETGDPATSAVDELFARIRADRVTTRDQTPATDPGATEPEASEPEASEPEASEPEAPADADAAAVDQATPSSDADESLLQLRESAVVDLEVTLTRRLKRALQDEQNYVLDRLRGLKGAPTVAAVLPDPTGQSARYVEAALPLLGQAAAAGADFAADRLGLGPEIGLEEGAAEGPGAAVDVDDLASEAASAIVDPLRRRLEQAIEAAGGDDDQAVVVESLGAAYRECKTQRIERLAGDALAAAFSRGTWRATPAGATLRWIVEDADGQCPDCDDDALAGQLPKGEAFPTGQHHPPAHSGCRCLLVPEPVATGARI